MSEEESVIQAILGKRLNDENCSSYNLMQDVYRAGQAERDHLKKSLAIALDGLTELSSNFCGPLISHVGSCGAGDCARKWLKRIKEAKDE